MALINVLREIRGRWRYGWITTYGLDLSGFEDHLLHRIGEPPLDVTLLVDGDRFTTSLESARASGQIDRLRWIGRRYLVRPGIARLRFHPKTYFFGDEKRGLLLVGSGNVGLQGLMSPGEVFSAFESTTETGLAAIRDWRSWMATIVEETSDPDLRDRWDQVMQGCVKWLPGPGPKGVFVDNSTVSLAEHLTSRIGEVEALLITSPFFDEHAVALQRLITSLKPPKVELWLGEDTSVNGASLQKVLRGAECQLTVRRWKGGYVHAKLVGVIGNPTLVLSGSGNVTLAGLWSTASTGNAEVGILVEATPQAVRNLFDSTPGPGFEALPVDLESLASLAYVGDKPASHIAAAVRLTAAMRQADGTLVLRLHGSPPPGLPTARVATVESGDLDLAAISGDPWKTTEAVSVDARLVSILLDGMPVSNWVVIDDILELRASGSEHGEGQSGVDGLSEADLQTEVGQLLRLLRSKCNFDYAWDYQRLVRAARLGTSVVEDAGVNPDDDIDIESIGIRPRRLPRSLADHDITPFGDLEAALASVPRLNELRVLVTGGNPGEGVGTGVAWSDQAKLRIRLYNVLARWCEAIRLPEAMYDEYQETRNFAGLVIVLAAVQGEPTWAELLGRERIVRLIDSLFRGFVGNGRAPGFLLQLPDPVRKGIVDVLEAQGTPALAGDLIAELLDRRRSGHRDWLVLFRPWLAPAIESGIVRGSDRTAEEVILWAAAWADDELWAEDQSRRFSLEIKVIRGSDVGFSTELRIGDLDLIHDVRAVKLVAEYLRFATDTRFTLVAGRGEFEQRLGVELGEPLGFRNQIGWDESDRPVMRSDVFELADSGGIWSVLFTSPKFQELIERGDMPSIPTA